MSKFFNYNIYSSDNVNSYNSFIAKNGEERVFKRVGVSVTLKEWVFSAESAGLNLNDYLNCRELAKTDERLATLLDELNTVYLLIKHE